MPVDRAGMEHKFRSNAGARWPAAHVDALLKALWDFEHTPDLRALFGQLALA
jgi:hypothetical protein